MDSSVGSLESNDDALPRRVMHMPDWHKIEDEYIESVRNGRHPISFKRKGELWHHCAITNERLARVSKGHKLINVLNEDKYYDMGENADQTGMQELARGGPSDSPSTSKSPHSQAAGSSSKLAKGASKSNANSPAKLSQSDAELVQSVLGKGDFGKSPGRLEPLSSKPASEVIDKDKERALIDFQLNGVSIDVRYRSPLNFGQLVVLMNENNECLCVDKRNIIRIKNKAQLQKDDKICLKMVDLREMNNPSEIRYGQPLWFQAVETPKPGESVNSNFFTSSVLGCKIFQLATIATQQLDENWADPKNKQREDIFKREIEVDSDEEYDRRMEEIARLEREKKDAEEAAQRPKLKGRGWMSLKKAPVKETIEKVKKAKQAERRTDDDEDNDDNGELVGQVCGSAIAVRMAQYEANRNSEAAAMANEIVSKDAMSLGLFIPHTAENSNSKDEVPRMGSVLYSNRPIYLCQDLYCLANSHGSGYQPWPLRARDFHSESADMEQHYDADGNGVQQAHVSKLAAAKPPKNRGKRGAKRLNMVGEYAVLRNVVKRREEYEYAIDRKCVWRICHVDNLSDAHQMTTAEITTAKVMFMAKERLRKSEMRRKGHKTYMGSVSAADNQDDAESTASTSTASKVRIPGGEAFALALRKDGSTYLLDKESSILESRREKEQILKGFLESKVSNWDASGPEDMRSMVSQMSFEYSGASPSHTKSKQPSFASPSPSSQSQASDVGSLPSQGSTGEGSQGRIMLPVGHEQAHSQAQNQILRSKTLVLRRYHYQQYPHFHKSPVKASSNGNGNGRSPDQATRFLDPLQESKQTYKKHFAFNASVLSEGERILALRQAFDGIHRRELDTLKANGGVDHSAERMWTMAGEKLEDAEQIAKKENAKLKAERAAAQAAARRHMAMPAEEIDEEENLSAAEARLAMEQKIKILDQEDEKMWSSVKHRRKVEGARAIDAAMKSMDGKERDLMEEQMRIRRASVLQNREN